MSENSKPIWVIAEQLEGEISPVSLQLTGKARILANEMGSTVEAVIFGHDISHQVQPLFHAGADVIRLGDAPAFGSYQSEIYTEAIVFLAKERHPQIMLLGSTFMGRELAPLVAARLDTGLTAHCTALEIGEDQILEQRIPAYGGMITIICPEKRPQMATVARGVFPMPAFDESRTGEIKPILPPKEFEQKVHTLEIVREEPEGVPLESARVVVAGGAGAETLEGWQEIKTLAEGLSAALGSTRPAVDEGWTELETMIGQSGKIVSPDIYLGIGISGELQHMVGIVGAKVMIAVNNDLKAPVFEQVDVGVVEDCREFLPVLIEKIRKYKG